MVNVKELRCPSCSAPLAVNDDSTSVVCEYCGVTSTIERPGGDTILKVVDEVVGSIRQSSDKTQEAIISSSAALAEQIETLELRDRLMSARLHLMSLDNEIFALATEKSSRKNRRLLAALEEQRIEVAHEISLLEIKLNPQSNSSPGRDWREVTRSRSCVWYIGVAFLILVALSVCSTLLGLGATTGNQDSEQFGVSEEVGTATSEEDEPALFRNESTSFNSSDDVTEVPSSEASDGFVRVTAIVATSVPEPTETTIVEDETRTNALEVVVLRNANLRAGPGTEFAIVGTAIAGESLMATARTINGWLRLDADGQVWIGLSLVRPNGEIKDVPLVEVPLE